MVRDQDVLRLEIPMEDAKGMAMLNGIQDLEEHLLGKIILTHVLSTLGNVEEEVSLWAVLQNDIDAVRIVDYFEHGNDVGVC